MSIERKEFTDGSQTYPPLKGGVNGQASGAFSLAHKMAFSGASYANYAEYVKENNVTVAEDEKYDLVIVGAGVSGLAAAFFYRKKNPGARVLLVECLEDFGGHAKRNEFNVDGRLVLGYGGSESFQSPKGNFSETMNGLVKDLGIDLDKFETDFFKTDTYPSLGMSRGSLFVKEKRVVAGDPTPMVADDLPAEKSNSRPLKEYVADFPVSEETKAQLIEIFENKEKVTVATLGLGEGEDPIEYLAKTDYITFLRKHWGASDETVAYLRRRTLDFFGLPANAVAALDCGYYGHPGLQGIPLPPSEEAECEMNERYIHHFPDGNASLARLLVSRLIPDAFKGVADGSKAPPEDILVAECDYSKLDRPGNSVRIKLSTTALRVKCIGHDEVDLVFANNFDESTTLKIAKGKRAIAACFNMILPFIIDELATESESTTAQRAALKGNVKAPLVYTNVVLKNWKAFADAKVHEVYPVDGFHCRIKLDYPVAMGSYKHSSNPEEPVAVHMVFVPDACLNDEGKDETLDPRAALRKGRGKLFSYDFEGYEKNIRSDLDALLGPFGFDFDRDVAAITVNRWSHGYAWVGNSLSGGDANQEMKTARAPIAGGHITIANSDSGFSAYLHAAVDEAQRAVDELKDFSPSKSSAAPQEVPAIPSTTSTAVVAAAPMTSPRRNAGQAKIQTYDATDRAFGVTSPRGQAKKQKICFDHLGIEGVPTDAQLQEIFKVFDPNGDNKISLLEFRAAFKNSFENFGAPMEDRDVDRLFAKFDTGAGNPRGSGAKDGFLSYDEFCVLVLNRFRQ